MITAAIAAASCFSGCISVQSTSTDSSASEISLTQGVDKKTISENTSDSDTGTITVTKDNFSEYFSVSSVLTDIQLFPDDDGWNKWGYGIIETIVIPKQKMTCKNVSVKVRFSTTEYSEPWSEDGFLRVGDNNSKRDGVNIDISYDGNASHSEMCSAIGSSKAGRPRGITETVIIDAAGTITLG